MVDTKIYQDTKDCVKFVVNWIDHSFLDCQQNKPPREQLFLNKRPMSHIAHQRIFLKCFQYNFTISLLSPLGKRCGSLSEEKNEFP